MEKTVRIKQRFKDGTIKFLPGTKFNEWKDLIGAINDAFYDARLMILSDKNLRQIDIYEDTKLIATVYG